MEPPFFAQLAIRRRLFIRAAARGRAFGLRQRHLEVELRQFWRPAQLSQVSPG